MGESTKAVSAYRYWAFLSYAHQDNVVERSTGHRNCVRWAEWLHQQLETYRLPKAFHDIQTPTEERMPTRFFPIFQDDKDLTVGSDLDIRVKDALEASRYLIVIASPRSAASPWVDREVSYFKSMGRRDRILVLIIDGEPTASRRAHTARSDQVECFCPGLRFQIGADGRPDESRPDSHEPIAGDVRIRIEGQLREVNLKHLKRHHDVLDSMKLKLVAGLMGVRFDELIQRDRARRVLQLRRRVAMISTLAIAFAVVGAIAFWQKWEAKQSETKAIASRKRADTLIAYMQHDLHQRLDAIGRLDLMTDVNQAIARYHDSISTQETTSQSLRERSAFLSQQADTLRDEGKAGEAMKLYLESRSLIDELLRRDPDNPQWLHDWTVSSFRIADQIRDRGLWVDAEGLYRTIGTTFEKLSKMDPHDPRFQKGLAATRSRIGDVLVEQGDLAKALESYKSGLEILYRQASKDRANPDWQSGLCLSQKEVGNTLLKLGRSDEAFQAYRMMRAIAEELTRHDAKSAIWREHLAESHERLGDALIAHGKNADAIAEYRAGLQIMRSLAELDPTNTKWLTSLSQAYNKTGHILRDLGKMDEASDAYQSDLAIRTKLLEREPDNGEWKRSLSVTYNNLGTIMSERQERNKAITYFKLSRFIRSELVSKEPDNPWRLSDLASSYDYVGQILFESGQKDEALSDLLTGLQLTKQLVDKYPGVPGWKRDLAVSYDHIGEVYRIEGRVLEAQEAFGNALSVALDLIRRDPGQALWNADAALFCLRVGLIEKSRGLDAERSLRHGLEILKAFEGQGKLTELQEKIRSSLEEQLGRLTSKRP
jgi:tetratricopeptide (TPR) repeat protein